MVVLPNNVKSIITGILLSDGWMSKTNENGHVRLSLKQSLKNKEYLLYSFNALKHYCKSYPKLGYTKLRGNKFPFISFTTRSLACFTDIYNKFYIKNKQGKMIKSVPVDLYHILTEQSLANWIAGDGSFKYKGLYLNTQSFTVPEVVFIINVLIIKFNCKCTLYFQKNLPIIYILVVKV